MSATRRSNVVVLAASFGGVHAHRTLLAALPPDYPAAVLVVQHRHPGPTDMLIDVLARRATLPVVATAEGMPLAPGTVYVVTSEAQAVLDDDGCIRHGAAGRCLADPLLESAARVYGNGVVAAILTGRLRDGTAGVRAVKRAGGRVLVQEPTSAAAWEMPTSAIATGCVDFVLPLEAIAPALVSLTMVPGAADLFKVRPSPWAAVA